MSQSTRRVCAFVIMNLVCSPDVLCNRFYDLGTECTSTSVSKQPLDAYEISYMRETGGGGMVVTAEEQLLNIWVDGEAKTM